MTATGYASRVAGVVAEGSFTDPENSRTIYLVAAALVVVASVVGALTVWWWRASRTEHPALGPLEVMRSRKWWASDYAGRSLLLAEARPEGAEKEPTPPGGIIAPVDLDAVSRDEPPQFDDLAEPAVAADADAGADAGVEAEPAEQPAAEDAVEPPADEADEPSTEPQAEPVEEPVASAEVAEEPVAVDASPSSGVPIDPLLRVDQMD